MRAKIFSVSAVLVLVLCQVAAAQDRSGVQRKKFTSGSRYLLVEILDDDLAHFELSESGAGSSEGDPVYVTPMIHAPAYQAYAGPLTAGFSAGGNVIETTELKLTVDADAGGVTVFDKVRGVALTKLRGEDLHRPTKRFVIDRLDMQNAYGVGNLFCDPGTADGDWIGRQWNPRNHGNFRFGFYVTDTGIGSDTFHGGGPSVSQFPILYAIGPEVSGKGFQNYALLFDQVYRLGWDLREDRQWSATMWGDQIRWFVCTGPDLKDLRRDVMELIGRPPVPPRSTFGICGFPSSATTTGMKSTPISTHWRLTVFRWTEWPSTSSGLVGFSTATKAMPSASRTGWGASSFRPRIFRMRPRVFPSI